MEQGFAPRFSRVAAGVCLLLFLAGLQYFFGRWVMLAVIGLPVLMALILTVAIPNSFREKKRIIDLIVRSVDVGSFFFERLDDHFESFAKRLRR